MSRFRSAPQPDETLVVVVVSACDPSRQAKARRVLTGWGPALRPGVWELALAPRQVGELEGALQAVLDEGDVARIYRICGRCAPGVRLHGPGDLPSRPVVWIF